MASVENILIGVEYLYVDNKRLIISEDGYLYESTYVFNKPASEQEIAILSSTQNCNLPEAYIQFYVKQMAPNYSTTKILDLHWSSLLSIKFCMIHFGNALITYFL